MKPGPDQMTIYRIARSYYRDNLSQDEIALREGFSRSQVSRLLDKAKEMGIVRIEVVPPTSAHIKELELAIQKKLGLRRLCIAPLGAAMDDSMLSRVIATAAADFIDSAIGTSKVVGIGWGRTVYMASELLPYHASESSAYFVPLTGISGDDNPNLQINTIIDHFSSKFRARGLFINSTAVRGRGAPIDHIEKERIANLRKVWRDVRLAIVGLGVPPVESENLIAELPAQYRRELSSSTVCGDILGQFFYSDGSLFPSEMDCEQLAFDIRDLRKLDRVICLAGGREKTEGIIAAARAGYITDLVIDEQSAELIAASLSKGE